MNPEAEISGALMTPESNPEPSPSAGACEYISRPPTRIELVSDRVFRQATYAVALLTIALVIYLVFSIARVAMPAIRAYGLSLPDRHDLGRKPVRVRHPAGDCGDTLQFGVGFDHRHRFWSGDRGLSERGVFGTGP